jgi:protein-tyrosine phosphatase
MGSRYAISFAAVGAGFVALGPLRGGWWWAALWPGVSFLIVALAYARGSPSLLGKRPTGGLAPWAVVVLGPYILFTWIVWHLIRLAAREPAGHEVAPRIWVGRRAGAWELPPDTRLVVDLTCEMWCPRGVGDDRRYVCLPTLDGTAPGPAALEALLRHARDETGVIYIHCAQGRGRSAALAAALLIARGTAADVDEAEATLRKARPSVRLTPAQRAWVARLIRASAVTVLFLAAIVVTGCAARDQASGRAHLTGAEIAFEPAPISGYPLFNARVNGRPARFAFDTGGGRAILVSQARLPAVIDSCEYEAVQLPERFLAQSGAALGDARASVGSSGFGGAVRTSRRGRLTEMRLGGVVIRDAEVQVVPSTEPTAGEKAVVGQAIVRHYRVAFDASRGSVTFFGPRELKSPVPDARTVQAAERLLAR